jgi:two-component system sensor histidine kinase EvgS
MAQKQAPLLSCADGPGVEGRFLDVLLASNEADMAAIVPAVAASDWSQAGSLAHRLKGAARLDSASAVARCCEALEAACAAGDATAANTALPLLQHAMAEWTENLQARRARLPTS